MKKNILAILVVLIIILSACNKETETLAPSFNPTPIEIEIPYGFPYDLNIPDNNQLTAEKVELGRYLFYDGRMSGVDDGSGMSCSSCHRQERAFDAGIDNPRFPGGHPKGMSGMETHHVSLPLINLVWNNSGYGWNGFINKNNEEVDLRNIEDFVRLSVIAEDELNTDTSTVVSLIQSSSIYPPLFEKAFGTKEVTFKRIEKAVASFVRTLISSNSRFDQYLRGETQLTQSEMNGYVLFTTEEGADCFHCHGGGGNPLFTTHLFYNNGKESTFNDQFDRLLISGDPMDKGAYKATTLRNIEFTGPYMHDGRFETLEEVVDMYSGRVLMTPLVNPLMHHANTNGVQLTEKEKQDLLSFLKALSDEDFITNPKFSKPEALK